MTYTEEYRDLFTMPDTYHLAHCIASDLGMGAGIAVPMQKTFGLRGKILNTGLPLHHRVRALLKSFSLEIRCLFPAPP